MQLVMFAPAQLVKSGQAIVLKTEPHRTGRHSLMTTALPQWRGVEPSVVLVHHQTIASQLGLEFQGTSWSHMC